MRTGIAKGPVVVVAESKQTTGGLQEYLATVGVSCRATTELGAVEELGVAVSAVVLFPDEFAPERVVRWIDGVRAARTGLLLVVVTNAHQRLAPALASVGDAIAPVIISKPVFGWAILDALRHHWRRLP